MSRLAFAVPVEVEDRLAEDCRRYGHEIIARCDDADELAVLLAERQTDGAVVATSPRYLTARLLAEADLAGTRLVGLTSSEADRRHASTLGLYELVDVASEWHEIEGLLVGVPTSAPATPAASGGRGTVIAVWGPGGAPGRTSIAITVAAELAASGHSVVLADADTYSGTIAPALGLLDESPGFAAACRLAGAGAFTAAEFDRIAQPFGSGQRGFRVLTGIGRPHRWPELSAARVAAVLTAVRGWADYVVVDTGFNLERDEEISSDLHAPRRNAATLTALREADRVIAVGAADPVGLSRFLRAHVDLLETVTTEKILVVMNRVRASAIGLNPGGQIAETLYRFGGISDPTLVPYDRTAFDAALLGASTVTDAAGRSRARQAVRDLVARSILDPVATPSRRGLRRGRAAPKERLA
ncbi:regulator [Diaminobutyricimonas sp. LJ205]|uniref:AAA family ATPase n=1 Tax=Diaminobutyricimonas sp. LJ205 TaxID=2683590 RepID=UPI0012F519B2|nr:regulator [Diaminobutyricimonas sp. LJ205]